MKVLYDDIDEKSRNVVQNILIAFDDNAWDKMEALLNEDDRKPVVPIISNILTVEKSDNEDQGVGKKMI